MLHYSLLLDDANPVRSDNGTPYVDGQEKVAAFTGSGDGMRFDTNNSATLETSKDKRRVRLDFSGTGFEGNANALKGIDFRFDQSSDPVNSCFDVRNVGDWDSVAANLVFQSSVPGVDEARLVYGGPILNGTHHDCGATGVSRLTVSRTSKGGPDVWDVVSGNAACFYVTAGGVTTYQGHVAMPVHFTLTALGPVPP